MYTYIHVYIHTYIHTYTLRSFINIGTRLHPGVAYMYIYTFVYVYAYIHIHMCPYVCIYIIHMNTCVQRGRALPRRGSAAGFRSRSLAAQFGATCSDRDCLNSLFQVALYLLF